MSIVDATPTTTENTTGSTLGTATDLPGVIDLRDGRVPGAPVLPATVDPRPATTEATPTPDPDGSALDTDRGAGSGTAVRTTVRTAVTVGRRGAVVAAWLVVILGAVTLLVPALLGLERYVIVGSSMSGTFEKGSVVFAEQVPVTALAVGDVITFQPPPGSGVTQLITHRIIDVEADEAGAPLFRTRGDANDADDPWTFSLPDEHQNRVVASVPHLGSVLTHLSDPANRMLVIGVPAALIALLALVELVRAVRPDRELDDEDADSTPSL